MKTIQGTHFRETETPISPSSSCKNAREVYVVSKEIHCCLAPEPATHLKNYNLVQRLAVKYAES